jgi:hypothetical protein
MKIDIIWSLMTACITASIVFWRDIDSHFNTINAVPCIWHSQSSMPVPMSVSAPLWRQLRFQDSY